MGEGDVLSSSYIQDYQLAEIQQDLQKNILFVNKRGVWGLGHIFISYTFTTARNN